MDMQLQIKLTSKHTVTVERLHAPRQHRATPQTAVHWEIGHLRAGRWTALSRNILNLLLQHRKRQGYTSTFCIPPPSENHDDELQPS
jgi:hypothetical protein